MGAIERAWRLLQVLAILLTLGVLGRLAGAEDFGPPVSPLTGHTLDREAPPCCE